jgi:hypothetical protein
MSILKTDSQISCGEILAVGVFLFPKITVKKFNPAFRCQKPAVDKYVVLFLGAMYLSLLQFFVIDEKNIVFTDFLDSVFLFSDGLQV